MTAAAGQPGFLEERELRGERHARQVLTSIRNVMAQARLIGWPELEASWRCDERRLLAHMAARGWKEGNWLRAPRAGELAEVTS